MGTFSGPNITNIKNISFVYQPGNDEKKRFINNNTEINYSNNDIIDTSKIGLTNSPNYKKNTSFGLVNDDFNGGNIIPTVEIKNISGSVNIFNKNSNIYTISTWVKIDNFPTVHSKYTNDKGLEYTTTSKRTSIVRFNYSLNENDINFVDGFIEFGAMAPYYVDKHRKKNFVSVYEPFSFGVALKNEKHCKSVYTDYKFKLKTWYLITVEITSNTTFNNYNQNLITKIYVNNENELITEAYGIAWKERNNSPGLHNKIQTKRKSGQVACFPGFKTYSYSTIPSYYQKNILFNNFFDLSRLNYISFSPIIGFDNTQGNINNGLNNPKNYNLISSKEKINSNIQFGGLYIYNSIFNSSLYDNFKTLYN